MPIPENILDALDPQDLKFYLTNSNVESPIRRYRQVFDSHEADYIFFEFSFYNLKYEESSWMETAEFKIYKVFEDETEKFIDSFTAEVSVTAMENECFLRQSWGTETPGDFWDRSEYRIEVWIGSVYLIGKSLFIEDYGLLSREENPYFNFLSVKIFEGPSTIPAKENRKYLSRFNQKVTRYIWTELEIQDKHPGDLWNGEFIFNYYNDLGEKVGEVIKLEKIYSTNKNNTVTIFAGIGSDEKVTWEIDSYTVEIIFMNQKLATVFFNVSDNELSGQVKVDRSNITKKKIIYAEQALREKEIFKDLDELIGLTKIKSDLHEYFQYVKYLLLRKEKGLSNLEELKLNFVFTGNPGTGKTTVARLMAKIFNALGVLQKDSVFEVERADLIGRYIGETAPLTKDVINKARGGILFIDEAYSLYRDDEKDFGIEAIEVLVKELSDNKGDLSVIVAGYPEEMKEFIESNSGLKSRFNLWYDFPDYTPDELMKIAKLQVNKKTLYLQNKAEEELNKIVTEAFRSRDKHFGNARFVNSIIEEAQVNLGVRIMSTPNPSDLNTEEISTIELGDILSVRKNQKYTPPEFPLDDALLKESLGKLNSLIGLTKVKTEISEIVKLVKFYRETNRPVLNSLSLHNVFTGNPGTGKTTVARILSDIYKALGLLEKGHLVECSREALVAGFVGQTALKTKGKIDESIGGMLFVDEAYALTQFSGNDFGGEAIEEILKNMEDRRGKFSLIAAGYIDEMKTFLESNPGLRSRFDNIIEFDDFTSDELMQIAIIMLKNEDLEINEQATDHLAKYFEFNLASGSKFFGNARFVRKVIDKSIRNLFVRLSDVPKKNRTDKLLHTITIDDVKEFDPLSKNKIDNQNSIGFVVN